MKEFKHKYVSNIVHDILMQTSCSLFKQNSNLTEFPVFSFVISGNPTPSRLQYLDMGKKKECI